MTGKLRAIERANSSAEGAETVTLESYVGQRLRLRRLVLGLRQEDLASALGISHQQVQKYEAGETRISFSRLFEASVFLNVSVDWFVDGYDLHVAGAKSGATADLHPEVERELLDFFRSVARVTDPKLRGKIVRIARIMLED